MRVAIDAARRPATDAAGPTHGGRIELGRAAQGVRRLRRRRRHRPRDRAGRVLLAARPVGLRQDHDAADDRRLRAADRRADPASTASTSSTRRPTAGRSTRCSSRTRCSRTSTSRTTSPTACAGDATAIDSGAPSASAASGEAIELVRLGGFEKRRPAQLSGGQQQRVALARALVLQPSVLLLDEPLGALDAKLRKDLQGDLAALQREVGITFVYVTHDQEEALTMSDRLAVMDGGHVAQVGTPERGLRATGDGVRRRLPRRRQPARRRVHRHAERRVALRCGSGSFDLRASGGDLDTGPVRARDPARTGQGADRRRERTIEDQLRAGDGRARRLRRLRHPGLPPAAHRRVAPGARRQPRRPHPTGRRRPPVRSSLPACRPATPCRVHCAAGRRRSRLPRCRGGRSPRPPSRARRAGTPAARPRPTRSRRSCRAASPSPAR